MEYLKLAFDKTNSSVSVGMFNAHFKQGLRESSATALFGPFNCNYIVNNYAKSQNPGTCSCRDMEVQTFKGFLHSFLTARTSVEFEFGCYFHMI